MKTTLILGTRPQIIKSAPLIHLAKNDSDIDMQVIHTGQHYDYEMSKEFFDELNLPDPTANLNIGSGTHAWQTGKMLIALEKVLIKEKPDLVFCTVGIAPGASPETGVEIVSLTKPKVAVPYHTGSIEDLEEFAELLRKEKQDVTCLIPEVTTITPEL